MVAITFTPVTTTELITPAIAEAYLAQNRGNRRLRSDRVLAFAEAIDRGEWRNNGQGIIFDRDGVLRDGQHRLQAITLCGRPITMQVTRGIEPEAAETLDDGTPRTAADKFYMQGEVRDTRVAAVAKKALAFSHGRVLDTHFRPTHTQILQFAREHPELRGYAVESIPLHPRNLIAGSAVSWLYYHLSRTADAARVLDYLKRVCSGRDCADGSPELAVRNRLLANAGSQKRITNQTVLAAFIVKGWNAYVAGRKLLLLRFLAGEEFPDVEAG